MAIKLIVGLRNPGSSYAQTRHNAGGWFTEALAHLCGASFKTEKKLHCDVAELEIELHACKLILPTTYMNQSGQPVREVCQFYRIDSKEMLVVHDDLDIPVGTARLKSSGGHGGHNGLRDIIAQLGTGDFHRLRIGIGHPGQQHLVHDYVLGKPSVQDRQAILESIDKALKLMPVLMKNGVAAAMNTLNQN